MALYVAMCFKELEVSMYKNEKGYSKIYVKIGKNGGCQSFATPLLSVGTVKRLALQTLRADGRRLWSEIATIRQKYTT